MKKMIQIGAGNIGRACLGRLFSAAGYHLYFSDVVESVLSAISAAKEYNVRLLGKDFDKVVNVPNVDRLPQDEAELNKLFDELDIITTAVGVNILPHVSPLIAHAIKRRYETKNDNFLNVMACENTTGASSKLQEHVYKLLNSEVISWLEGKVAFANVAIDCIVPAGDINKDPMNPVCENFAELIIDEKAFLGEQLKVDGILYKANLPAYVERKLFTLNTGHAITAYLGFLSGKKTVADAISDKSIEDIVCAAMKESGNVLIKRHGFEEAEHHKYIDKILNRFFNPYMEDLVVRVGREPMRKLSYSDRLIKPLLGTLEYSLSHENLMKGIVAAFQFFNPEDPESLKLKELKETKDLKDVVLEVTGLSKETELCEEIYKSLQEALS